MLTAKADLTMKLEGLNRGADDYLVKPFSPEELRARVRSLLRIRLLHGELEKRNGELHATLDDLQAPLAQVIQSQRMRPLDQLVAARRPPHRRTSASPATRATRDTVTEEHGPAPPARGYPHGGKSPSGPAAIAGDCRSASATAAGQ